MKKVCFIFLIMIVNKLNAQPTNEQRMAKVKVCFIEKNDTISFMKKGNEYVSTNNDYVLTFFSQDYILDMIDFDKFLEERKRKIITKMYWDEKFIKDSLSPLKSLNFRENKLFAFIYYPSSKLISSEKITPSKDILIRLQKKNYKMNVILKLYNSKSQFEGGSSIFVKINFKDGDYEIIDVENPVLIASKKA